MSMVYPHVELAAYCDLGLQHGFWLWFSFLCLGVVAAAVVVSIVCMSRNILCILLHLVAVAWVLTVVCHPSQLAACLCLRVVARVLTMV